MKELYFILEFVRAYKEPDPIQALIGAFANVETLGQLPEYRTGYAQFHRFLREGMRGRVPDIFLEREGKVMTHVGVLAPPITDISPGRYTLKAGTGRVLWSEQLTESDLLLSRDERLPMAAHSEPSHWNWTQEWSVLNGKIWIRSYQGIESGTLRIHVIP